MSIALREIWDLIGATNRYMVTREPWKLAKDDANRGELAAILYASAETLRILAVLIEPIMPAAASRLWTQLGIPVALADQRVPQATAWGQLEPGTQTTKGESLFPRVEADADPA